jgi:hypothetical protein
MEPTEVGIDSTNMLRALYAITADSSEIGNPKVRKFDNPLDMSFGQRTELRQRARKEARWVWTEAVAVLEARE